MRIIRSNFKLFVFLMLSSLLLYVFLGKETGMKDEVLGSPVKTVCVGRLLIDVPKISIVSFMGTYFAGWSISAVLDDRNFDGKLIANEIEKSSKRNEKNKPSLEKVLRIDEADKKGAIFVYDRRWVDRKESGRNWVSQIVEVSALVKIKDVTYKFMKEFGRDGDDQFLLDMVKKMSHQQNGIYSNSEGFCIDQIFIPGKGMPPYTETTAISIALKDHPDLRMVLSTAGNIKKSEHLLDREEKNIIKRKYKWLFSTVRKGPRSIDNMPGEEIIDMVRELNGTHSQDFMWESLGNENDIYMPVISFELNTGHGREGPVSSSLKDAQALALWERISATIRRRAVEE